MYYKRTRDTTDPRGTWVAGYEISCSLLLINFVYKHAEKFPEFQEKNANEGNSPRLFLKEIPLIRSQTRREENLLPESRTSTSQQDITIECPGLGARPKPSQQCDIVVGNFGREGKKRYGIGQGIVPIDESQRGRINELDLNGLITVFHSKRVRLIWEDLFPTARGVFPCQFILPIPEHLMAVDTSALICMLITIQTMRDVKTTGRVDDETQGGPEAGSRGDQPMERGDSEGSSLLGPKSRLKPVRDLSPRPATPYLENNGSCVEAKIIGFSAGSYTAIVVHRALTLFGIFMKITPHHEDWGDSCPPLLSSHADTLPLPYSLSARQVVHLGGESGGQGSTRPQWHLSGTYYP
jgi:hypothetical protein